MNAYESVMHSQQNIATFLYIANTKKYVDYLVISKSLYGDFITCGRLHNLWTIIIDKSLYLQTFL